MIGEDQSKGYPEEQLKQDSNEEFEKRKEKALKSIGIPPEKKSGEIIMPELKPENNENIAKKAMLNMKSHKDKVLDHDIIILRQQNQQIIKSLNGLTKAVNDLIHKGGKR